MIDHYRFITDTRGWELPAGRVDPGESVDAAAGRELLEETGHSAASWTTLGQYHPSNGSSNQVFHLKIARDLTRQSDPTDTNETMALRWFEPREIRELLRGNEIRGRTLPHWTQLGYRAGYPGRRRVDVPSCGRREEVGTCSA